MNPQGYYHLVIQLCPISTGIKEVYLPPSVSFLLSPSLFIYLSISLKLAKVFLCSSLCIMHALHIGPSYWSKNIFFIAYKFISVCLMYH